METHDFETGVATHRIFRASELIMKELPWGMQMIVSSVVANGGDIDEAAESLNAHSHVVYSVFAMFRRVLVEQCPEARERFDEWGAQRFGTVEHREVPKGEASEVRGDIAISGPSTATAVE